MSGIPAVSASATALGNEVVATRDGALPPPRYRVEGGGEGPAGERVAVRPDDCRGTGLGPGGAAG